MGRRFETNIPWQLRYYKRKNMYTLEVSFVQAARLLICNVFILVFRTQKGVIVPGIPSGDQGHWE